MQTPGINYRLYADWRLDWIALTPGAWMLQRVLYSLAMLLSVAGAGPARLRFSLSTAPAATTRRRRALLTNATLLRHALGQRVA